MTLVERIEPIEKRLAAHAIKLYKVAHKMAVDDRPLYSSVEIFVKHLLRLLGMTAIAHVFLVHSVKIASLDPA